MMPSTRPARPSVYLMAAVEGEGSEGGWAGVSATDAAKRALARMQSTYSHLTALPAKSLPPTRVAQRHHVAGLAQLGVCPDELPRQRLAAVLEQRQRGGRGVAVPPSQLLLQEAAQRAKACGAVGGR